MFKKLLFLLVLIDICGFSLAFRALTVELPWFAARDTQSTAEIETPLPVQPEAILPSATTSELPATPVPTGMPVNPTSYLTSNDEQLSLIPVCFAPEEILPFAFTPEATRFLMRASSGVQIFDLETGAQEAFIHASQNVITAALSPDGQNLAWSFQDGRIQLIRLSDQKILADLRGHPDPVYDLQFSPAGDKLFSASHDGLVRIWGLGGESLASIESGGEVLGIGLSGDGSKIIRVIGQMQSPVWELFFSPDASLLAVIDGIEIRIWRVEDGTLLYIGKAACS